MKFELLETYLRLSETKPFQEKGRDSDGTNSSSETLSSYCEAELNVAYPEIAEIVVSSERDSYETSNYRKKRKLAQGGMGLVFEAEQRSLKRDVVIKEIYQDDRAELLSHRLIHEARLAGKLEHPNVAPVYELGQTKNGRPILVMKRIDGISWKELLHDPENAFWHKVTGDRLVWNLNVLIQICNAVAYAHDKGVVHRDIKPENIMLGQFGEVYLLDWGLAFDITKPVGPLVPLAAGTPAYMAPEMLRGIDEVDFRTDVYLLGAVLYELLVGYGPHKADSASEAIQKILVDREFPFPKALSQTIVSICQKAISFDKEDRFQSVSELRQRIQEHLSQSSYLNGITQCCACAMCLQ